MCLYPRIIQNKKYIENKKNRGVIPPILDSRVLYVPIGCQRCMECKHKKAREWNVRLLEEVKHDKGAKFVTLTFSNESIKKLAEEAPGWAKGYELDNWIATRSMRLFLERWRKKYRRSVKHWFVTELGHRGTENLHMHGLLWTDKHGDEVERLWSYGFIWRGGTMEPRKNGWGTGLYVNSESVSYITKYMQKMDEQHKYYEPKILTSPGIGGSYRWSGAAAGNKYKPGQTAEYYRNGQGYRMALPIYYRNSIYSDEERELLWLERLNKGERWVGGVKVAANDAQGYYGLLKHYRKVSKRLGYGDDKKDWNQEQYELGRRELLMWRRIQNTTPHAGGAGKF